jgi:primase/DNA polymerase family protein/AAA domain-containing protein
MTITELQEQKRWVLWKLETVKDKQTKVPYQPNGRKAKANDRATWHGYAECAAVSSQFSGIGLVLGDGVWGCDIDACCDAVTGKFSAESREIVIGLDSYAEYSPSGTGCHILGLGNLPGPGIKKPFPGSKAVEVKSDGFYFTYTARHLNKTPSELMDRQEQITALYNRISQSSGKGLSLGAPIAEEERLQKLIAGDTSAYNGDHSAADFALCILLAKKYDCDAFKIDEEFQKSGLYREKWEREDYKRSTIKRAIMAVAKERPVVFDDAENDSIEDDGVTEYLVDALPEPMHEGWFPKGEVSLIGGSSGAGKTSWAMPLLEKIRKGADIFGHSAKPRDYRVLLHDRSKKAMQRTVKALGLSAEAIERVIRLTSTQQSRPPAEILEAAIEREPGVECWFIEGLDLWITDPNKMEVVGPVIDGLQRIATRRNVSVLGTVGSPKQRGKDNKYSGRDTLFGSAALARKVETVVLMQLHNDEDPNSVRRCTVLPRNGRAETLYFEWQSTGLCLTTEPQAVEEVKAVDRMEQRIFQAVQPGGEIKYQPGFGNRNLFFEWKNQAMAQGKVTRANGKYYRAYPEKATVN